MKSPFRLFIVISVGFSIIATILSLVDFVGANWTCAGDGADEKTSNLFLTGAVVLFSTALFAGAIAGLIGLFCYKKWGRTLSLVTTIISMLFVLVCGESSEASPVVMFFYDASTLFWGAVLAMAYYSEPVAAKFSKKD